MEHQQASLQMMCECFLAEVDNGRRGGFPVETLALPHVVREKFEAMGLPTPIRDIPFDTILEMVEAVLEEEKASKSRRSSNNTEINVMESSENGPPVKVRREILPWDPLTDMRLVTPLVKKVRNVKPRKTATTRKTVMDSVVEAPKIKGSDAQMESHEELIDTGYEVQKNQLDSEKPKVTNPIATPVKTKPGNQEFVEAEKIKGTNQKLLDMESAALKDLKAVSPVKMTVEKLKVKVMNEAMKDSGVEMIKELIGKEAKAMDAQKVKLAEMTVGKGTAKDLEQRDVEMVEDPEIEIIKPVGQLVEVNKSKDKDVMMMGQVKLGKNSDSEKIKGTPEKLIDKTPSQKKPKDLLDPLGKEAEKAAEPIDKNPEKSPAMKSVKAQMKVMSLDQEEVVDSMKSVEKVVGSGKDSDDKAVEKSFKMFKMGRYDKGSLKEGDKKQEQVPVEIDLTIESDEEHVETDSNVSVITLDSDDEIEELETCKRAEKVEKFGGKPMEKPSEESHVTMVKDLVVKRDSESVKVQMMMERKDSDGESIEKNGKKSVKGGGKEQEKIEKKSENRVIVLGDEDEVETLGQPAVKTSGWTWQPELFEKIKKQPTEEELEQAAKKKAEKEKVFATLGF